MKILLVEIIGKGSFGTVYLGFNLDTSELVAVKELRFDKSDGSSSSSEEVSTKRIKKMEEEIKLMQNLNHGNIVQYYGTSRSPTQFYIFMEYMTDGSLSTMLKKGGPLPEDRVKVSISIQYIICYIY